MKIGFDFDGTLACWMPQTAKDYDPPEAAMLHAAALVGPVAWLKKQLAAGHEVVIVTGRGEGHQAMLATWLRVIVGRRLPIYVRPRTVGLDCASQAAWKASVIRELALDVYVGDNDSIDLRAAIQAGVVFQPAQPLIDGQMPLVRLPIRARITSE